MVKHTQTIRRLLLTNCLSVFDHFVGLELKGLMCLLNECSNCVFYEEINKILVPSPYLLAKIETLEEGVKQSHWRRCGVFIVNFSHISHLALVFLSLTLNM